MGLEAMTTDPMYTTEVYKRVAVNETSVTGNEDSSDELKNAAPEVGVLGEVGSGADTVEFEEDWSQKCNLRKRPTLLDSNCRPSLSDSRLPPQ